LKEKMVQKLMDKIGRNDPCPCGSGKKYKKCCLGKRALDKMNKNALSNLRKPLLPNYRYIDYGVPVLNADFFKHNNVHEISAPRLVYSILLSPEISNLASQISNSVLGRGKDEAFLIENATNAKTLLEIMKNEPDSLNHERLIAKTLEFKDESIALILEELNNSPNSAFVELAIRIIHSSEIDCSNSLIKIIEENRVNAYSVSLLCMLLGFHDGHEVEKLLWDYFHYFKEHFEDETYSDGPLLGLSELRARRKERSSEENN